MYGFRNKARAQGVEYVTDEVVAIGREGNRVTSVTLEVRYGRQGRHDRQRLRAARRPAPPAWRASILPVEPRKRTLFVFDCATSPEGSATINNGRLPLMIDVNGVHCRPEGRYFLTGAVPVDDTPPDYDDFEPGYERVRGHHLAGAGASLEGVREPQGRAPVGGSLRFQHARPQPDRRPASGGDEFRILQRLLRTWPAAGTGGAARAVSELITYGAYRTLDLSEVGYERIIENKPFLEKAVI